MSTIKRALFEQIVKTCRGYDPFTQYIDDYTQELQAEARNRQLDKDFNDIMEHLEIEWNNGVPCDTVNKGRETESAVEAFLKDRGIDVEPKQVPTKRIWTEQEIKDLVQTNDTVLYGALSKLYDCQTSDEQRAGATKVYNGVGFNGADSRFLSSVSEFLRKKGFLTDKQKSVTRRKLVKYTKQLTRLANA